MYIIEEILHYLKRHQEVTIELKRCPEFNKLSSLNRFGEFISVCCSDTNKEVIEMELQQLVKENKKNLMKVPLASFCIKENKIFLKLDWMSTVKSVFTDIFEFQNSYGSSNQFFNKSIAVYCGESDNELTMLRMRTAYDVVSRLVTLGGGQVEGSTGMNSAVHISPRTGSSFLVGSVHLAGSTETSTGNYLRFRRTELGESGHRELCEETIDQLLGATVVFDLLSIKLSKPLILNSSIVPPSATRSNCKGATFVLYNYARICSILDKFEDMVTNGVYKPLSSFHDLNYNLLLKEEEWRLVFDFLARWPSVVAECQDLSQSKLHNIVTFLSSLASTFSVFYKYNRVLNVGLAHMVPVMEARIHLLKAIKQVFLVAFHLLRINAPVKM